MERRARFFTRRLWCLLELARCFTSVAVMPDEGGEVLSILGNSDGQMTPATIWEQHADAGWARYGDADSWNLNASLMIFPNVCR